MPKLPKPYCKHHKFLFIIPIRGKWFRKKGGRKTKTGIILFQKYKLLERTGEGNGSEVYVAEHIRLHALRAVKCVDKAKFPYEKLVKEVVYLKSLSHPGIPVIYDVEEDEKYFYIIEEYIQGESLKSMLDRHRKFSLEEIIEYGVQLCQVIEYLHGQRPYPILHSDITPANIMIKNEKLKLIDFGNSVQITGKEQSRDVYGTIGYIAPESMEDVSYNVRADIYGVCAVMQDMYREMSLEKVTLRFTRKREKFKKIIEKGLWKEAEKRYGDICEVLSKLKELQETETGNLTSKKERKHMGMTIGCAGITPASGVTTLAFAIGKELQKQRKKVALLEVGEKRDFGKWKIWQEEHGRYIETIRHGFRCDATDYYPKADNNVLLYVMNAGYEVIVVDFGCLEDRFVNNFRTCNRKIILGNYSVWNYEQSIRKIEMVTDDMITTEWKYATLCSDKKICTMLENKLGIQIQYLLPLKSHNAYDGLIKEITENTVHKFLSF